MLFLHRVVHLMVETLFACPDKNRGDKVLKISDRGVPRTIVSIASNIGFSSKLHVLISLNFMKSNMSLIIW